MEIPVADLVVAVFFLSALVLVARCRTQLSGESREGYRYISAGLVILTLMAVSSLYSKIGVFCSIPFLSDPVFYRLIFWIGTITGLTMLVSGMSRWLLLSRDYRKFDREKWRRLDFIKRVEQLVGVERRLPVILSKTLQYAAEHFDLRSGAVYIYSQGQQKPVFLCSCGLAPITDQELRTISFDENVADNLPENDSSPMDSIVIGVPASITRPDMTMPVAVNRKISAVFLLWQGEKSVLDVEDRINLKIAAGIISREVELQKRQLDESFRKQQADWLQSLVTAVDHRKPIKESILRISRWLTEVLHTELISFTITYEKKNTQRYSVSEDGALLNEKSVNDPSHRVFLNHVLDSDKLVVVNDVRAKTTVPVEKMILDSGMKSLVAFRLGYGQRTGGAVVIASRQANRFRAREIELINVAVPFLSHLVSEEIYRHHSSIHERRVALANSFLADCGCVVNLQDLFQQAATLLSKELRTSVVRISTYEYDGAFLKSRALVCLRPIEGLTPTDGHMILSLMPYHTLVRETGRLMMINQEHTDKKMAEAEAGQVFSADLKSALLIPITVGRQVLAVVSLAEMRRWTRYQYSPADVLFAGSVASGLSLAIQLALGKRSKTRPRLERNIAGSTVLHDPMLKSRIKSSLSSIMGSVEMIKSHKPDTITGLDRYLSIIDRSAQKINGFIFEEISP